MSTPPSSSDRVETTGGQTPDGPTTGGQAGARWVRVLIVAMIVVLVLGYTVAVVVGAISPSRRLSATHIALLVVALLAIGVILRPDVLKEIGSLKVGTTGVEFARIQKIEQKQETLSDKQVRVDEVLNEILFLLVPRHLADILTTLAARERDANASEGRHWWVNKDVESGLRQLRDARLVEILTKDGYVSQIPHDFIDLVDYARLTPLGRDWAKRVEKERLEEP